jgi:hypothetical protein
MKKLSLEASLPKSFIRCSAIAALATLIGLTAAAQSGRRATKPQPTVAPETVNRTPPVVEAEPPAKAYSLSKKVSLLLCRHPSPKHFPSEDSIYASFVKRVNEIKNVTSTPLGDMKHDQAVARARSEVDGYVVWMQFEIDSYHDGAINLDSHDLAIKYQVFDSRSGKELGKGKVYYQPVGGKMRGSNWPSGTPVKITEEAAGIEAAEQLYYSLVMILARPTEP